jgi:hypothetical protein
VKNAWRIIIDDYYSKSKFKSIDKKIFPGLLAKLYEASFKTKDAGFKKTGLFPLDRSQITEKDLAISASFHSNSLPSASSKSSDPISKFADLYDDTTLSKPFISRNKNKKSNQIDTIKAINDHTSLTAKNL